MLYHLSIHVLKRKDAGGGWSLKFLFTSKIQSPLTKQTRNFHKQFSKPYINIRIDNQSCWVKWVNDQSWAYMCDLNFKLQLLIITNQKSP